MLQQPAEPGIESKANLLLTPSDLMSHNVQALEIMTKERYKTIGRLLNLLYNDRLFQMKMPRIVEYDLDEGDKKRYYTMKRLISLLTNDRLFQ